MNTSARKATALLLTILALGTAALVVHAQQASYYNFAATLNVSNTSGSDLTNALVPFDINVNELVNAGYLNVDGQDILVLAQSGGAESLIMAQATTTDPGRWWVSVDALANGETASFTLYTGQNTTAADNPQYLLLTGTASLDFTIPTITTYTAASVAIDGLVLDALPSTTASLVSTTGGIRMTIATTGVITAFASNNAPDNCTVTSAALAVDTEYDIEFTVPDPFGAGLCVLKINGATASTDSIANGNFLAAGAGVVGDGFAGRIESWTLAACNVCSPPYPRIQRFTRTGFQMPNVTETQEGTAANGWIWKSSVVPADGNAGVITRLANMSAITATVGPITAQSAAASTGGETDPEFVAGPVNPPVSDPYVEGSAASDFGFPFNIFATIMNNAGAGDNKAPIMFLAGLLLIPLTLGAGFAGYKYMGRIPAVGMFCALIVGGYLVMASPLPNVTIVLLAIGLLSPLFIVDRPLEARA
jgi:hypothetical protein